MGFNQTDDDIFALPSQHLGIRKHAIGFTNARGCTNIDAKPCRSVRLTDGIYHPISTG
jgi:hypothetical protein